MSPHNTPAEYMLSPATDRDRLYLQFDLFRDWFRGALGRATALAGIEGAGRWSALDVACGEGLYAADIVREQANATVVGCDRDTEAILTARTAFGGISRLAFHVADVHEPLVPIVGAGFDVAYLLCALTHFREGSRALANVYASLRPGGAILLLDPTERMFDYPHPSLVPLRRALSEAWPAFGTYAAGDRSAEMLAQAGFVEVVSEPQNYTLGGATTAGRAKLALLNQLFGSLRRALVERARTIDAVDFDTHTARLTQDEDPSIEGTYFYRMALARKPA